VHQTLAEIGADHIPVLTALNKIDRLNDPEKARTTLESYSHSVAVSALKGDGIADLLFAVNELLYETFSKVIVRLPFTEGSLIALFHEQGQVERVEQQHGGVFIQGRLPGRLLARYQAYLVNQE
jgi:GTP-binding protein HflX